MTNMYDFICSNSSYFDQAAFDRNSNIFIDYLCPLTEERARVWSHKNCLMFVSRGAKGYATSVTDFHESKPHQILFIRKGGYVLHQRFNEPYHALIFMFDDESIKDFLTQYPAFLNSEKKDKNNFMKLPVVHELESSPIIESIFTSSLEYLKTNAKDAEVVLNLKFRELLYNLLNQKESNIFRLYLSWIYSNDNILFLKLMHENCHYNFAVDQLAKTAGMSLSTFKRVFKKNFGISPGRWLREQRIQTAKQLLMNTDKTVSEIAFELGYNDASAFTKAFKQATHKNPSYFQSGNELN